MNFLTLVSAVIIGGIILFFLYILFMVTMAVYCYWKIRRMDKID